MQLGHSFQMGGSTTTWIEIERFSRDLVLVALIFSLIVANFVRFNQEKCEFSIRFRASSSKPETFEGMDVDVDLIREH